MSIEIERKFLVIKERLPELIIGEDLLQGYLCENPLIRFRIKEDKTIITIKELHADGSRFEFETEKVNTTVEEKRSLEKMCIYPVIQKTRYRLPFQGLTWEVDVYKGENEGLITVDVELPEIDYKITFPEWVDIKADITNDVKYFNINLGRKPYKQW